MELGKARESSVVATASSGEVSGELGRARTRQGVAPGLFAYGFNIYLVRNTSSNPLWSCWSSYLLVLRIFNEQYFCNCFFIERPVWLLITSMHI